MFWLQMAVTFGLAVGYGYYRTKVQPLWVAGKAAIPVAIAGLVLGVAQLFGVLALCLFNGGFGRTGQEPMTLWAWVLVTFSAGLLIEGQTLALQNIAHLTRQRARESIDDLTRHNSEKK